MRKALSYLQQSMFVGHPCCGEMPAWCIRLAAMARYRLRRISSGERGVRCTSLTQPWMMSGSRRWSRWKVIRPIPWETWVREGPLLFANASFFILVLVISALDFLLEVQNKSLPPAFDLCRNEPSLSKIQQRFSHVHAFSCLCV
jgi:hypothetical protein